MKRVYLILCLLARGTIIFSMRFRLQDYLLICLSVLMGDRVLSGRDWVSNSHNPCVALFLLPSTNTFLLLYLKLDRPILNEPLVLSWKTPKLGSCNTLRFYTLWMYFECVGELSVSDSISVLNRGTQPIIRFRLGFVLKLGLVLHVSIIGMGMGFPFCFSVFNYGSWYKRTWVHFIALFLIF